REGLMGGEAADWHRTTASLHGDAELREDMTLRALNDAESEKVAGMVLGRKLSPVGRRVAMDDSRSMSIGGFPGFEPSAPSRLVFIVGNDRTSPTLRRRTLTMLSDLTDATLGEDAAVPLLSNADRLEPVTALARQASTGSLMFGLGTGSVVYGFGGFDGTG